MENIIRKEVMANVWIQNIFVDSLLHRITGLWIEDLKKGP